MKSSVAHTTVDVHERKALSIHSGDTVRVWQKIVEKGKTRRQAFEGLVLAVKHGSEPGAMFTVRKVASGVGMEKIFPLYSPMIDSIEVVRRSQMRRSKLYFIRRKAARDVKHAMRKTRSALEVVLGAPESASVDEAVSVPAETKSEA